MTTDYGIQPRLRLKDERDAATLWRVATPLLATFAVVGFVAAALGRGDFLGAFMRFDWTHNVGFTLLAIVAAWFGVNARRRDGRSLARFVALALIIAGVVGFALAVSAVAAWAPSIAASAAAGALGLAAYAATT